MSNLTDNTATLQAILDAANALPEAGGSSGGNIETCTVTIEYDNDMGDEGFVPAGVIVTLSNGVFVPNDIYELPFVPDKTGTTGNIVNTYRCTVPNVVRGFPIVMVNTTTQWQYNVAVSDNIEDLEYYFGVTVGKAFLINGDGEIKFTIV